MNRQLGDLTRAAFFLLTVFGVTWTLNVLWRPPQQPGSAWDVVLPLLPGVWAPTLLALTFVWASAGLRGIREEVRTRFRYSRGTGRWLLASAFVPSLATAISMLIARAAGDTDTFIPSSAVLSMIGFQLITGATGEEFGWRGYLLPRLAPELGPGRAAWTMATFWSLWHLPAFVTPGMPHQLIPLAPFLLTTALFGVVLAFFFNKMNGSILATIVAHLSFNICLGFGGVRISSPLFWWTLVVCYGVLVAVMWRPTRAPGIIHRQDT